MTSAKQLAVGHQWLNATDFNCQVNGLDFRWYFSFLRSTYFMLSMSPNMTTHTFNSHLKFLIKIHCSGCRCPDINSALCTLGA